MQTAAFVLLPESTSPARGTTGTLYPHSNTLNDFNPRPPHGGRLSRRADTAHRAYFNPRPPHGGTTRLVENYDIDEVFQSTSPAWGTTSFSDGVKDIEFKFQSTSPVRGTTTLVGSEDSQRSISIHVPRAGDDSKTVQFFRSLQHVLHYFLLIGSSNPILF